MQLYLLNRNLNLNIVDLIDSLLLLLKSIKEDIHYFSLNYLAKINNEKYGMILAVISVFFGACGAIYTKIIQKSYPDDFKTVQFLFLRSFTIFFFAIFHSYIRKEKIMKLIDIPEKIWFFLRTNANFFGVACMTMALWYLRASTTIIIQNIHPLIVLLLQLLIKIFNKYNNN